MQHKTEIKEQEVTNNDLNEMMLNVAKHHCCHCQQGFREWKIRRLQCLVKRSVLSVFIDLRYAKCVCL